MDRATSQCRAGGFRVVVTEVGGSGRALYRGARLARVHRFAVTLPRQVAASVAGGALSVRLHWTVVSPS